MKVKPGWFTQEMCFTAQTIHFKLLQFIWECVHSPVPVILLLFSDLPYLMDWLVCVGGGECPHVPLNAHPALGAAPWHVTDSRLFGTSFASMFRSGKRHLSPVWTSLQKVLGWLLMAAQLGRIVFFNSVKHLIRKITHYSSRTKLNFFVTLFPSFNFVHVVSWHQFVGFLLFLLREIKSWDKTKILWRNTTVLSCILQTVGSRCKLTDGYWCEGMCVIPQMNCVVFDIYSVCCCM